MKTVLVMLSALLFGSVAHAENWSGNGFVGAKHISRMNELDHGATMPQIGAAFRHINGVELRFAGMYGDSKVVQNDLIEPNDEWYLGAEVNWNFGEFKF